MSMSRERTEKRVFAVSRSYSKLKIIGSEKGEDTTKIMARTGSQNHVSNNNSTARSLAQSANSSEALKGRPKSTKMKWKGVDACHYGVSATGPNSQPTETSRRPKRFFAISTAAASCSYGRQRAEPVATGPLAHSLYEALLLRRNNTNATAAQKNKDRLFAHCYGRSTSRGPRPRIVIIIFKAPKTE